MKRALVVDDTKNIRILLAKCLEIEGYEVACASDGYEAVRFVDSESFDVIILDIKMPHFSGTDVLSHMRAKGIKTPVIIITAYATIKNAVECTQMGAVAYLQKPFTADRIHNILADMCINSQPSQKNEYKVQAMQYIEEGQHEKAIRLLKTTLSDSPLDAELYRLLSDAYQAVGSKEEAGRFKKIYESFENDGV